MFFKKRKRPNYFFQEQGFKSCVPKGGTKKTMFDSTFGNFELRALKSSPWGWGIEFRFGGIDFVDTFCRHYPEPPGIIRSSHHTFR